MLSSGGRSRGRAVMRHALSFKQRLLFLRQLAVLVRASVPPGRALQILERQALQPEPRACASALHADLLGGYGLAEAAERRGGFPPEQVALLRAGERSGRLADCLEQIVAHAERADKAKRKALAALAYPAVVGALSLGILALLLAFVVPRFESVYAETLEGAELPGLTRAVSALAHRLRDWGWSLPLLFAAAAWGLRRGAAVRPGWALVLDRLRQSIPVLGQAWRAGAWGRVLRTQSVLLATGVPLLEALELSGQAAGSAAARRAVEHAAAAIRSGEGLARAYEGAGYFPPLVVGLVGAGEETGDLAGVLLRAAESCEDEADARMAAATALVEPLLVVLLSGAVGTVVIAVFLPMVGLIEGLSR